MTHQLQKVATFTGHEWQCSSVHFHPSVPMVASASWDRTIRIWDVEEKQCLSTIERGPHKAPITCVRWHPNGTLLASTSADNTTCLWDASTGQCMKQLHEHFGWVLHCSFAPDRTKLATASWDKTVRLWDPNTGELISTLRGHTKGVLCCAFYPVGHSSALLASCGEDCTARLWDTRSNKIALTLSGGHADAVHSLAWSHDGNYIATTSADITVTIWDPKAGRILRLLKGHEDTVKDAAFAPPSPNTGVQCLATAGGDSALLWNPTASMNNLLGKANYHEPGKEVEAVSFSHNGKLLATGGRDGTVVVCRVPEFTKEGTIAATAAGSNTQQEFKRTTALEGWLAEDAAAAAKSKTVVRPRDTAAADRKKAAERAAVEDAMKDERGAWVRRASKARFSTAAPRPKAPGATAEGSDAAQSSQTRAAPASMDNSAQAPAPSNEPPQEPPLKGLLDAFEPEGAEGRRSSVPDWLRQMRASDNDALTESEVPAESTSSKSRNVIADLDALVTHPVCVACG